MRSFSFALLPMLRRVRAPRRAAVLTIAGLLTALVAPPVPWGRVALGQNASLVSPGALETRIAELEAASEADESTEPAVLEHLRPSARRRARLGIRRGGARPHSG